MIWRAPRDGRPGRPAIFSDAAIQVCLSIEILFKLPFCHTAGMGTCLLKLAGLDWPVPDFPPCAAGRRSRPFRSLVAARIAH